MPPTADADRCWPRRQPHAFVPYPLPPREPPLELDAAATQLLNRAEQELGRLELASGLVPSLDWFIYGFVRKEAVVTSQIEGTEATLVDLLTFEARDDAAFPPSDDVREVCNYLDALRYARGQLRRPRGLQLSMRLLSEAHRRLMRGTRGRDKQPGELRRSQNWIGGTRPGYARFVPPPPRLVGELVSDLERYLHADDSRPPLVRVALLHAQFETIHPYLDGNGRIGRLLIALLLEHWRLLSQPLLYLSLHFKRNREEYYRRLDAIRGEGDWEGWTRFFLEAVAVIAAEATAAAGSLFALVTADRRRALASGRSSLTALRLLELLPLHPVVSVERARELLETTKPTAAKAIDALVAAGILEETTGRRRDRAFRYSAFLDELRAGTELER